jgi:hypothetical protein
MVEMRKLEFGVESSSKRQDWAVHVGFGPEGMSHEGSKRTSGVIFQTNLI